MYLSHLILRRFYRAKGITGTMTSCCMPFSSILALLCVLECANECILFLALSISLLVNGSSTHGMLYIILVGDYGGMTVAFGEVLEAVDCTLLYESNYCCCCF